jgi:hypothetical protein
MSENKPQNRSKKTASGGALEKKQTSEAKSHNTFSEEDQGSVNKTKESRRIKWTKYASLVVLSASTFWTIMHPTTIYIMLLATLVGIFLLILQTFLIKNKEAKEKYKDLINNSFLLIATFVGVVIALYLADIESQKEKREKAKTILEFTANSLAQYQYYLKFAFIDRQDSNLDFQDMWKKNTNAYPEFLILKTPELLYTMSDYTFNSLHQAETNIVGMEQVINEGKMNNEQVRSLAVSINSLVGSALAHLDWEYRVQDHRLDTSELHELYRQEDSAVKDHYIREITHGKDSLKNHLNDSSFWIHAQ